MYVGPEMEPMTQAKDKQAKGVQSGDDPVSSGRTAVGSQYYEVLSRC
jgi:hypothetical protein